ncbi:MAG: EAL domain-containing protein [Proteobacteria bacterium]|nr:EAL domain-containing protein [Pseudomonadota bacterium]
MRTHRGHPEQEELKSRFIRRALGTGALCATLVLAGATAFLIEHTRKNALERAETVLDHNARNIEGVINRQFIQTEGALAQIPLLLADGLVAADAERSRDVAARLLQGLNFQNLVFRDLVLAKPSGEIWAAARTRSPELAFAGDAMLRLSVSGTSLLIGPNRNRMTGDWNWHLVRKINLPGQNVMLAAAEIPIAAFLTGLLDNVDITKLDIHIERANGRRIGSLPHDEMMIGRIPAEVIREQAQSLPNAAASSPTPKLELARTLLLPDLVLRVSMSQEDALSDWREERSRFILLGTGASTLILLIALGIIRLMERDESLSRERRRARVLLIESIEAMSDGFVMWDEQDRLVMCNNRFRELYALSAEFLVPGATFEDVIRKGAARGQYPQAQDDVEGFVNRTLAWHRAASSTVERLLPDGRWLMISDRRTPSGAIVGIRTDITSMRSMLDELGIANARIRDTAADLGIRNKLFDAAVNNMSQGLLMADGSGRVIVHNARFAQLLGIPDWDDSEGLALTTLFARIEEGSALASSFSRLVEWQSDLATAGQSGREVLCGAEGRYFAIVQQPLDGGGFVATYDDVTDRQAAEERIRFLAHHDSLTELPNRVLFRTGLATRVAALGRSRQGLAILYLDLDKFKDVNDTLGHPAGDALLGIVARRLRACLRDKDLVARLGGDEFAVVISGANIAEKAEQLARRIIPTLSAPYELDGQLIHIGVSIGVAITESKTANCDTLIRNADMALYEAKAKGRGGYCLFESGIEARLFTRLATERDLGGAVAGDQFELAYQPLIEMASGRTIGFEALLRWNHPTRGLLGPGHFIPLAEETGLIREIGAWCLRRATHDMAQLPPEVKIAVNLSPVQLKADSIVSQVLDALRDSGLAPGRLELEITESALLDDDERIVGHLHKLREAGVRIVLDDFGTGYSSLNYLRRFPFNKIKIDKVFVAEATTRHDCKVIVSSTIELARQLGMSTTGEGIETAEQSELLRQLGCTEGQGYLFGKPAPLAAALARFEDRNIIPFDPKRAQGQRGS